MSLIEKLGGNHKMLVLLSAYSSSQSITEAAAQYEIAQKRIAYIKVHALYLSVIAAVVITVLGFKISSYKNEMFMAMATIAVGLIGTILFLVFGMIRTHIKEAKRAEKKVDVFLNKAKFVMECFDALAFTNIGVMHQLMEEFLLIRARRIVRAREHQGLEFAHDLTEQIFKPFHIGFQDFGIKSTWNYFFHKAEHESNNPSEERVSTSSLAQQKT